MKIRGLIVATLAFLILGGILYWSNHRKPAEDTAKADTPPAILNLNPSAITKLDIQKKNASPIVLSKAVSGNWQITAPRALGADQAAVSGIVATLASLNSERMVEDNAADLKQYGLEPPALQLDITEKDKQTQKLLIGDETPTAGAVYAMLAGGSRVFTIAAYARTSVDKSLDDLRDKRLLTVNPDKISRIELLKKNQDIEFGRIKDDWQILKPKPLRADRVQVSELARKLTEARMDIGSPAAQDAASAFARATPLATAKVTDESGTQELEVRKSRPSKTPASKSLTDQPQDVYYAKSSAVEGAYKINSDLAQSLDRGLDDFRNKKLFDFGFGDPNKMELHVGSKAYFLTRSGEDWWQDGKKMDAATVQSLISKLRDLTAEKFSDAGFANPATDVTVTSDDGKRVERILIAKSGRGYLARRESEPVVYQLNATAVDDVQKAAGEIKPAATGSK